MTTDEAARGARTPSTDAERAAAQVERSAAANGTVSAAALDGEIVAARKAGDPAAIEAEIARRREHLAATVDELVERANPRALASRGVEDARGRLRAAVFTPTGELRTERVAAVAAAVAVLVLLRTLVRHRRKA